ncbi:lysine transporter LysE [Kocuria tytonicola]|uniref:LysE family translocator n=1 Tax=Kocuria tytonicola TaxID=2055946 RepID=UPI000EF95676|nr:LysE family translocator [Kocuria tytonicola]RLZ03624.1 lysine transporter LysE [Kocuria tytonicola]
MDMTLMMEFWVLAFLLVLVPGPDWAYAIGAGMRARSAAPSVLGMLSGYVVVVAVVAVGVGGLVTEHPAALTTLSVVGAGYLLYLGITALAARQGGSITAGDSPLEGGGSTQFVKGIGVSTLNPKGLLLLMALLPQFVSPQGWSSTGQMLVLGGLHILNCAAVYFAVALLSRRLLGSRPGAGTVMAKLAGVMMLVVGLGILGEKAAELLG